MIRNILMAGVGGQGILLAGRIIAGAARNAGFDAATYEIHGMAQRGGAVVMHIKFGDRVESSLIAPGAADILGSLEPVEALRQGHYLKKEGFAVVSATPVIPVSVSTGQAAYPADVPERLQKAFPNLAYYDFSRLSVEKFGSIRMANSMLLGVLARGLAELDEACWRSSIETLVKPGFAAVNMQAFELGKNLK